MNPYFLVAAALAVMLVPAVQWLLALLAVIAGAMLFVRHVEQRRSVGSLVREMDGWRRNVTSRLAAAAPPHRPVRPAAETVPAAVQAFPPPATALVSRVARRVEPPAVARRRSRRASRQSRNRRESPALPAFAPACAGWSVHLAPPDPAAGPATAQTCRADETVLDLAAG